MLSEFTSAVDGVLRSIPPWAYVGLVGAVAAGWGRIKAVLGQAMTHVFALDMLDSDLGPVLMHELQGQGRVSPFGSRHYAAFRLNIKSAGARRWVGVLWVRTGQSYTFWIRLGILRLPVWVNMKTDNCIEVRYVRGSFDMPAFIARAVGQANDRMAQATARYCVIRLLGSEPMAGPGGDNEPKSADDSQGFSNYMNSIPLTVDLADIGFLPGKGGSNSLWLDGPAQGVLDDARRWYQSRKWYEERSLAWRRGFLLHGPPGSGKTSLARAIAVDLDVPVVSLDLGSMTNQDLNRAWAKMLNAAPCVALIEDVDAVYVGRSPIKKGMLESPPSFDWLLNMIDGVECQDGVLLVVTTNDMDKVDVALGGRRRVDGTIQQGVATPRPGRIDKVALLSGDLPEAGRRSIAGRILKDRPDLIDGALDGSERDTPARFQERCVRIALADREGVAPDLSGLSGLDCSVTIDVEPEAPEAPVPETEDAEEDALARQRAARARATAAAAEAEARRRDHGKNARVPDSQGQKLYAGADPDGSVPDGSSLSGSAAPRFHTSKDPYVASKQA